LFFAEWLFAAKKKQLTGLPEYSSRFLHNVQAAHTAETIKHATQIILDYHKKSPPANGWRR